eukprot:COSAG02_NODE_25368_length_660_cov_1.664884_1_plen_90_part_01
MLSDTTTLRAAADSDSAASSIRECAPRSTRGAICTAGRHLRTTVLATRLQLYRSGGRGGPAPERSPTCTERVDQTAVPRFYCYSIGSIAL